MIQGWYCKEKLEAGHSRGQQVECIGIRAESFDRSNILNAWRKRGKKQTNKQTDRQTKFSWIFLEEARRFSTATSCVLNEHHGLVLKCKISWKRMIDDTSL